MAARLMVVAVLPLLGSFGFAEAGGVSTDLTCGAVKTMYKDHACCGSPEKKLDYAVVPKPQLKGLALTPNPCAGKKPSASSWDNKACFINNVRQALDQAGANVTVGYQGLIPAKADGRTPITKPYFAQGVASANVAMCPVNVHWHLGAEHLSVGEFDETGVGPNIAPHEDEDGDIDSRRLAAKARKGFECHKYDASDAKFTTEYHWNHCQGMHVGETYEVHWPHSMAGMCGTPHQYQTPFYDGVFCRDDIVNYALDQTNDINTWDAIGVQAQVFTIVNDEDYFYPDMMRGMIVDGDFGSDIGHYTGSTTGTSRSNTMCSAFTPITWQVDRKCHLISASSFDKMCADMLNQADDMSGDTHAHGARELVSDALAADNLERL